MQGSIIVEVGNIGYSYSIGIASYVTLDAK
jgi:hypothetical protein